MKVKSLLKKGFPAALIIAGSMTFANQAFAQVKVGDNPLAIDANSALEVESTNKGIRYPRVTLTATDSPSPLTAHVKGMTVYNLAPAGTGEVAVVEGVYINDGSQWQLVNAGVTREITGSDNPPPASLCTVNGTIYTYAPEIDDPETDPDFGKQWICSAGAWNPFDGPTKTASPFWAGVLRTGRRDVGSNKTAPMWRGGPIKLQYEKTPGAPNTYGSTYLSSNGTIQLYRGTSSAQNPFISFTNNIGNAQKMGIFLRAGATAVDESFLAFQSKLNSTSTPYTTMLVGSNGTVNVNGNITLQSTLATGTRILSVGADGTGNLNQGQGTKDGIVATYTTGDGSNVSIQNGGALANLYLSKASGAGGNATFIQFRANGTDLGAISRDGATNNMKFPGVSTATSDRRLKENIKDTHFSVSDLMKIEVKDYNYKSDDKKVSQTGFIAQDLYKTFPIAVTVGGDDVKSNPWRVNYAALTPLLVKAIQDQQNEIASLKAQLEEMNTLKAEVASIKSLLGKTEAAKDQPAK